MIFWTLAGSIIELFGLKSALELRNADVVKKKSLEKTEKMCQRMREAKRDWPILKETERDKKRNEETDRKKERLKMLGRETKKTESDFESLRDGER